MNKGLKILSVVVIAIVLLGFTVVGCQPQVEIQPMGVTNLDSLHLSDTAATATPILMVDGPSGNAGNLIEARVAATPVWYLTASGVGVETGVSQAPDGSASAPAYSFSNDTDCGLYRVGANNVGMAVTSTLISDWSSNGLDMNSLPVVNIGAAGTDFGSDGSLTTAQTITVTAGGLVVTAGGATITAGGLDMTNDPITNIGAAGTDFGSDGSLTTAQTITVTAGGLVVSAGGATVTTGGLTLSDGDAVVADDLRVTAQTAITVTNGAAFTPTGTYQGLQVSAASSEVTPTITMAGTAGDLLVLINTTTPTISIADSGTTMLSAEWEAGQYDTLTLWCDGTNWLELSRSDN